MKKQALWECSCVAVALVLLFGCKKEHTTIEQPDQATTVRTYSYTVGPGRELDVDTDGIGWITDESIATLTLPDLHPGDRVIAILQVGLQMDNSCTTSMHLSAGTILGTQATQTPDDASEINVFGGTIADEVWPAQELLKQFTRTDSLTIIGSEVHAPVVQAYVKPWSFACGESQCYTVNGLLTVVVVSGS